MPLQAVVCIVASWPRPPPWARRLRKEIWPPSGHPPCCLLPIPRLLTDAPGACRRAPLAQTRLHVEAVAPRCACSRAPAGTPARSHIQKGKLGIGCTRMPGGPPDLGGRSTHLQCTRLVIICRIINGAPSAPAKQLLDGAELGERQELSVGEGGMAGALHAAALSPRRPALPRSRQTRRRCSAGLHGSGGAPWGPSSRCISA